jgi:hypothetical protein
MTFFASDLHRLSSALEELSGRNIWQKPFVIPEINSPSLSTLRWDVYFRFSIGDAPLIECVLNLKEVCMKNVDRNDKIFNLRGVEMPVINCFGHLKFKTQNTGRQTVMCVKSPKSKNGFAVFIDSLDINCIANLQIGKAVPPKAGHPFEKHARECWDTVDGEQLVFVDWESFV